MLHMTEEMQGIIQSGGMQEERQGKRKGNMHALKDKVLLPQGLTCVPLGEGPGHVNFVQLNHAVRVTLAADDVHGGNFAG